MKHADRLNILLIIALLMATIISFEGARHNGFVFDDTMYITNNPHVQRGLTGESVIWAFSTPRSGSWHPLTWLSHLTDCSLFGLDPAGHHMANLAFHALNAVLLFLILLKMTGAVWPSVLVAAVFAVHPLRVESVAWVAERKDVLSGMFWMTTVAAYVRYVERPGAMRYLLIVLSLMLGLMSKPMLVTLPFVLLLLDYWPLNRLRPTRQAVTNRTSPKARPRYRKSPSFLIIEKIPLFVLAGIFSIITHFVQKSQGAMILAETGQLSLSARLMNALVSYWDYIANTFYPVGLSAFYPHPGEDLPLMKIFVSSAILVFLSLAVVFAARRGKRYALVGWLWYLGVLVPVIGLVQVGEQAMADRYTYLPSIGLLIIFTWAAADLLERFVKRRHLETVLVTTVGIVLAVLIVSTRAQVRYWKDGATLYRRALEVTEDNYLAFYNLARIELQNGRIDKAIEYFGETLRLKPTSSDAHNNLGIALRNAGRVHEAIEHFREALRIRPDFALAHNNLGQALGQAGQLDEAARHLEEAIRIQPGYAKAHFNLAHARARQKRIDEAIKHCEYALQLDPNFTAAAKLMRALLQERTK